MTSRALAIASGVLVCAACKGTPRPDATERRDAGAWQDAVAPFDVEPHRAKARVPAIGFAAVTRDAVVLEGASGNADVATSRAATRDTPFLAASIAKIVVATCVMQLVEERRLDLDADVGSLLGFAVRHPKHAGSKITMRMLLVHTSSIRDDFPRLQPREGAGAQTHALGAFLRAYLARPESWTDEAPGTKHAYSNVGASLAAYAVEKTSDMSFAEVSRRRVFEPLAMRATSWTPCPDPHRAHPHALGASGFVRDERAPYPVYPAVDLWSTPHDLARFARAVLRGGELDGARILSSASVDEMLREERPEQALAWQLRSLGGKAVAGHEGEDRGASTGLFLDRANGTGAVMLANGDAFASGDPRRSAALADVLVELLDAAGRAVTVKPR